MLTKFIFGVGLFLSSCIVIYPSQRIIKDSKIYKSLPESKQMPWIKKLLQKASLSFVICFISYSIPSIALFISFTGSLFGTMIIFVFPYVFNIKTFWNQMSETVKFLDVGILIYGSIAGLISTYITFI